MAVIPYRIGHAKYTPDSVSAKKLLSFLDSCFLAVRITIKNTMNEDMQLAMQLMLTLQERTETMRKQAQATSLGNKGQFKQLGEDCDTLTKKHVNLYGKLSKEGQIQYTKFCKENFVY